MNPVAAIKTAIAVGKTVVTVGGVLVDVGKMVAKWVREDREARKSTPLGDRDVIIQLDAARNAGKETKKCP